MVHRLVDGLANGQHTSSITSFSVSRGRKSFATNALTGLITPPSVFCPSHQQFPQLNWCVLLTGTEVSPGPSNMENRPLAYWIIHLVARGRLIILPI